MQIKRVVVNASPLICLSKAGLLSLFPSLFDEIVVPEEVYQEISGKTGKDSLLIASLSDRWLKRVTDVVIPPSVISWDIGDGESSVLSFALQHPDYWAVIDDREARRCAASLGCKYTGTIGIILLARKRGVIPSIRECVGKLQDAGLWVCFRPAGSALIGWDLRRFRHSPTGQH